MEVTKRKRALVISGGGSKGAFAGGVAEYLIKHQNREYDIFVGSSTGALIVPLLCANNIDQLKKYYTSITQEDIYSINPFRIKTLKDGSIKTKINFYNVVRMMLKRKKTFGETQKLRETIRSFFTEEDFKIAQATQKKVIVTVSNLSKDMVEYKYISDCSYEDFCDWIWASTCWVPFMSMAEKNGFEYVDGGFGNYIPIEEAIHNGAQEVDVIVLRPQNVNKLHNTARNAFEVLTKSMWFMLDQIVQYDLLIGYYQSKFNNEVNVNFIFTPYELTEHSYYFDPKKMKEWWQLGFDHIKNKMEKKESIIKESS